MVPGIGTNAKAAGPVRSAAGCWRHGPGGLLPITELLESKLCVVLRKKKPAQAGRSVEAGLPHPVFYVEEDGGESATGRCADGAPLSGTRRRCVRSWKRCSTT
jgi:hypothetical protein